MEKRIRQWHRVICGIIAIFGEKTGRAFYEPKGGNGMFGTGMDDEALR